jgi:flagellar basal-body rod protein FlgC
MRGRLMNVSSVMNTALSGMRTQTNKVSAIASNVANISTPGYGRIDPDTLTADEGQSVDPAMELTGLIQAEQSSRQMLSSSRPALTYGTF